MNSYKNYKLSKIDWINKIPSHWEIVKPKYRLNRVTRPIDEDDDVITCFRDGIVTLRKNRREGGFTNSIKEHGYQQIKPGDLVVHEMDGFAGAIGISDSKGKSTPVYTVVEPDQKVDLRYVVYLLREMSNSGKIESLARSIRQRTTDFRWNMWSVIHFPFPPVEEQKLISDYLDKKNKYTNLLIEKIKKKIKLLKEQLTSKISQCVTKGLQLNVDMKDSGVQWIGKIPKNWQIIPNKYIFLEYFGGSWGLDPEDDQKEDLVKVIRVTEFNMEKLCISSDIPTIRSLNLKKDSKKYVKKNDLILEKSGGGEKTPVGRVVLVDKDPLDPTVNSNFTNICRPNLSIVYPRFVVYSLWSKYKDGQTLRNIKQTTGIQNLDLSGFMTEKFILPSLDEQIQISNYLNNKSKTTNDMIHKLNYKIKLLKEHQQSLISSAVAGNIRVIKDMM